MWEGAHFDDGTTVWLNIGFRPTSSNQPRTNSGSTRANRAWTGGSSRSLGDRQTADLLV